MAEIEGAVRRQFQSLSIVFVCAVKTKLASLWATKFLLQIYMELTGQWLHTVQAETFLDRSENQIRDIWLASSVRVASSKIIYPSSSTTIIRFKIIIRKYISIHILGNWKDCCLILFDRFFYL
jgi:hypothetical protein